MTIAENGLLLGDETRIKWVENIDQYKQFFTLELFRVLSKDIVINNASYYLQEYGETLDEDDFEIKKHYFSGKIEKNPEMIGGYVYEFLKPEESNFAGLFSKTGDIDISLNIKDIFSDEMSPFPADRIGDGRLFTEIYFEVFKLLTEMDFSSICSNFDELPEPSEEGYFDKDKVRIQIAEGNKSPEHVFRKIQVLVSIGGVYEEIADIMIKLENGFKGNKIESVQLTNHNGENVDVGYYPLDKNFGSDLSALHDRMDFPSIVPLKIQNHIGRVLFVQEYVMPTLSKKEEYTYLGAIGYFLSRLERKLKVKTDALGDCVIGTYKGEQMTVRKLFEPSKEIGMRNHNVRYNIIYR